MTGPGLEGCSGTNFVIIPGMADANNPRATGAIPCSPPHAMLTAPFRTTAPPRVRGPVASGSLPMGKFFRSNGPAMCARAEKHLAPRNFLQVCLPCGLPFQVQSLLYLSSSKLTSLRRIDRKPAKASSRSPSVLASRWGRRELGRVGRSIYLQGLGGRRQD